MKSFTILFIFFIISSSTIYVNSVKLNTSVKDCGQGFTLCSANINDPCSWNDDSKRVVKCLNRNQEATYKVSSSGVKCTCQFCYYEDHAIECSANSCAREHTGKRCTFNSTEQFQTVRYGQNGVYSYKTFNTSSGSTACSNAVFGDPLYGTVKDCYLCHNVKVSAEVKASATIN